jgi:hypothetical protein
LWMAFQPEPGEDSANVAMLPNRLEFGNFDGNTMHSNQGRGVMFDNVEVDAAGNVEARQYFSTSDGLDDPTFQNLLTFTIRGWTLWKNSSGNFWNRTYGPTYEEFVSADGASKFFAGSGADGVMTRCLLVGHSLNDLSPLPFDYVGPTAAFATYHSTFAIQDNIVMHFPHVEGLTSGAFASDDYYFRPVEKGHIQNFNNRLIDAHPGHRSDAAILEPLADAFALGFDFFVFAGAVWDPQGIWGAPESWNVYDRPFFTHNAACSVIAPSSQGAASCDGEYYGVDEFILDAGNLSYEDYMAISVDRLDGVDPSIVVDTWEVSEAQPNWILAHMRHFAARQNGMFLLDFPGVAVPADVSVRMTNLEEASDSVVLGVRFSGTEAAQVYSSTYGDFYNNAHATSPSSTIKHDYTAVGSREEVMASISETYWQDTANNTVWIKVASGDIQQAYVSDYDANNPVSDVNLYNEFRLRIWIAPDLPITGGNFEDDFAGDGPLLGYTTNNPDSLPEIARVGGRYRANLTDNTANITLHFHDDQGRLDAKLLTFPFEVIARNIGIGTQADSQVAPPSDNNPYLFAGVQVHVPDLESRNSTHVVVGHRGGAENTVEGKNTVNGSSSVNDDGTNIVPDGRADIRIVGNADHTLTVYWQVPNLDPANQADNWESYGADGSLPLPAPTYGDQVYVGLITYAYNSAGVPFVGTCDGLEGGSL